MQLAILATLATSSIELCGLQLWERIRTKRPSTLDAAIYYGAKALEKRGLVTSSWTATGSRCVYRLVHSQSGVVEPDKVEYFAGKHGLAVQQARELIELYGRDSAIFDQVKFKKRGPPSLGGVQLTVKVRPAQLAAIDAWIARQPDPKPSRPEALRLLAARGLNPAAAEVH